MHAARLRTASVALAASVGLVLATTGVAQAAPVSQQAQQAPAAAPAASAVSTPVTGSFTDALGGVGNFAGTFTPTRFVNQNGQLAAVGTLTGTLTNSAGTSLGAVNQQITVPVQAAATCDILNLDLGPLDLNLLGLQVHLDEVVLDITAQQGPGNLLGNLLCAVAGLLDNTGGGSGVLNGIVALLNRILGAL
ncbi:hypothetical protein GCE86_24355 [Micromonospora terminaliae]|uniref:ABC transporter substrate-binding protein n=1 Tax=Micromonospora terminaliae TaxID=1914461 RepID=A0AAJ2ZL30_9ACTN|nr:hypothetical protein [Micromonospora terminaliae]NES31796.1 hypothetical protein [Micromonospora terminaliae]QGL49882.1 hypothetical protein GCE86_24355 [Micromonospora terminaliae]